MSVRTLEEEKEYDELSRNTMLFLSEEEKQQAQERLKELEKKEENKEYKEYCFQQDLIDYDIQNLTLRQLQERYIEDYGNLADEYETLENNYEELQNEYDSISSDLNSEINDLKEELALTEDSVISLSQQLQNYKNRDEFPTSIIIIFFLILCCIVGSLINKNK